MTTHQEPETVKSDKLAWTIGLGFSVWALVTFFVLFRWWGMRRNGMETSCGEIFHSRRTGGVDLLDTPSATYDVVAEPSIIPFGIRCSFATPDPTSPYVVFYDYGTLPLAVASVALLVALVAVALYRRRCR